VALSFENVCEIYISDGAWEGLEKWLAATTIRLQVISRQNNFGRLEKCLEKKNKKKRNK